MTKTPLDVVSDALAKKRRSLDRQEGALRHSVAHVHLSAYDLAGKASSLAQTQGAIDVLEDLLHEFTEQEVEA